MTHSVVARANSRSMAPVVSMFGWVSWLTSQIARSLTVFTIVVVATVATVPLTPVATQQVDAMALSEILERVGTTYAAMSVYIDRGTVTTTHPGETPWEPTHTFTTKFERSKKFSWTTDLGRHDTYRIEFDGVRVVSTWNAEREVMTSIGHAIGAAAGISHLSSIWIPGLLLRPETLEMGGLRGRFRRATSASRLPDEVLNGRPCFVIGSSLDGSDVRVWISKRDFLVRRIEQRYARYNSITTTDYTPQTDISLNPQ